MVRSRRKKIVLLAVLIGSSFLLAAILSQKLFSRTTDQSEHYYMLRATFEAEVRAPIGRGIMTQLLPNDSNSKLTIESPMHVKVTSEGDHMFVFFSFSSPQINLDRGRDVKSLTIPLEKALTDGLSTRFDKKGQLDSLYMKDDTPQSVREILWDLASTISVAKPTTGSDEVRVVSLAPGKEISEKFKWHDIKRGILSKSIVSIKNVLGKKGFENETGLWHVTSSSGSCEFKTIDEFFPKQCTVALGIELKQNGQLLLRGNKNISFSSIASYQNSDGNKRNETKRPPLLDLSLAAQKRELKRNLAANNAKKFVFSDELNNFREKSADKEEWAVGPRMGWTEKMADYLLLHPKYIKDFVAFAIELGPKDDRFSLLPHTLSVSGTPEAQAGLIQLAETFETDAQAMFQIVSSMLFLDTANAITIEYLENLSAKKIPQTSDVALLALGKYGNQNDPQGIRSFEYVRENLTAAKDNGSKAVALSALGNGGRVENLQIAMQYMNSDDPELRRRAVDSLRFVESEERYPIIFKAMTTDSDTLVRVSAAASLQYQLISVKIIHDLLSAIQKEKEISVRIEQYKSLTKYGKIIPDITEIIQELRSKESNGDLQSFLESELSRLE